MIAAPVKVVGIPEEPPSEAQYGGAAVAEGGVGTGWPEDSADETEDPSTG